jgi:hypothetical protein
MHMTIKSLVAALLASSPLLVAAVEEHHPDQAPAKAGSSSAAVQDREQAMTEQMKKMQSIHDRIAAAKTPEERQEAMREGMQAMKEGLVMMQNGCPGRGMGQHMMMRMMDQQSGMMGPQPAQ